MTRTIRIPARFIDDHYDRSLPAPKDTSTSDRYAIISVDDPCLGELLSDAEHYASPSGPDAAPAVIVASAKATVRAIRNATTWAVCPADIAYLRTSGAISLR